MKKKENQVYEAPQMKVLVVELEQGIAAASGAASPGASPSVDDWGDGGSGGGNWEGQ